jgi:hypothetical protein
LEPELSEVVRSGTRRLPLAPVRVSLINEAQLRHGFNAVRKTDLDPAGDKSDHTLAISVATTDIVYVALSEPDSEDDREVYMVGQGDQLPKKTTEEI